MLNNIFEEWEFIKTIPKDSKPCFSDKTFVSINEWFATFKRRRKGEVGEKGVIYINNLIDNTFKYYKNTDINSLKKLKNILNDAILGISNLVYTYKVDLQETVSDDYAKCIKRIEELIKKIVKDLDNKNFFIYSPKIINSF